MFYRVVLHYGILYHIVLYHITFNYTILYYTHIYIYIVFHYYIQFHLDISYIFIPKIPDEPMPPKQPGNLPLAEAPRSNGLILASKSSTSAIILCCSVTMKTTYS